MTSNEIIAEVKEFCAANASKENVEKYSRYFKGGINAWGLTQPQIDGKVKDLLKSHELTLDTVLEAAPMLIASDKYEEPGFALLLINGFSKTLSTKVFKAIEGFYTIGITNWAHADVLGMFILPQFINNGIITMEDFGPWLSSPYKFQRRSVPVTLIKYLKANKSADFKPIFQFLAPLMTDPEREVHQGMGWFLREAWKIQPKATESFLLKWKNKSPRLIFQYATEKMDKENKLRFKKEK
ncbi:MAG: DNA alkylation repair protein [Bacteroidota bacterium]|nr:DNA alkylation repair protein [Bacteroidota bacterium]